MIESKKVENPLKELPLTTAHQGISPSHVITPLSFQRPTSIFGTDGLRGTANDFPITSQVLLRLGQSIGCILKQKPCRKGHKHSVLIGKDTRISGYMIEQALSSGLNSMGVHVNLTGPLPTPGIGFLAQNMRVDTGIIISASHNAYPDNGVKIFDANGFKISESMEKELEDLIFNKDFTPHLAQPLNIGRTRRIDDAAGRYIVHAKGTFPLNINLEGLKIILDCAHGAAYKVAPAIFEELGARVLVLGNEPNGFNINKNSGALFPSKVCEAVIQHKAHVGISLDGDGDRVIMVDEGGKVINGDHILAICAIHRVQNKSLPQNKVVATHMSNKGLELALEPHGIEVLRTDVGDKFIVKEMRKKSLILGGEPSGHIIHLDHSTTGDGCIAALYILSVMKKEKKALSQLSAFMKDIPQVLVNAKVNHKYPLNHISGFQRLKNKLSKTLGDSGRIYVRYSGTESVIRILVEGEDEKSLQPIGEEIASFLQKKLKS